jgi:Uma2 family endonuclease
MAVAVEKRLLSAGEFYRLCQAGILGPHERVELADGELVRMTPIGPGHHAPAMPRSSVASRGRQRLPLPSLT